MQKKLSIVIPTYNYAHTLTRAVESVAKKRNDSTELIVVNDGSTDNTAEMLRLLTEKHAGKLSVFHKQNGGLASTRNIGIAKSIGQYLVFLDADDEMTPEAILHISKHLNETPNTQFLIGAHYSVTTNGKKKLHLPNALPTQPYDKLKAYLIRGFNLEVQRFIN